MMKYDKILVIINWFYAAVQCQQKQHPEVNLVNRLNDYYGFDHNIFLLDRSLDIDRYVSASPIGFAPHSVYTFTGDGSGNNFTVKTYVKNITIGKNPLLIVAVANLNFGNESTILGEIKRIRNVQIISNLKIGIFVARNVVSSTHLMERLFRWSWIIGIVNIFTAFSEESESALKVFRYDPITFSLVNLTEIESFQNYFPNKIQNYEQHPLRFVKINRLDLLDFEIGFWRAVARAFNASESTINVNFEDKVWLQSDADILLHEMTLARIPAPTGNVRLYTYRMISLVLLVPHARPYSDIVAYLQNATWELLFAYTLAVIITATLLLILSGYLHSKKILLVQCFTDVVNLLINDNAKIPYGRLHLADAWIIVPLTFTGLIMMNGIVSVFQSFLTAPIYERQNNTIEDLFESKVPILAENIAWANRTIKRLESLNLVKSGGWSDRVYPKSREQLIEEVNKFNNFISVAIPNQDIARGVLEAQKRLNLKAYHLMTVSLEKTLIGSQVRQYFPFIESLNDLIHRSQSSGLMDKWQKDYYQSEIKNLWRANLNRKSDELQSSEFTVPTVVWAGWMGSVITFTCEVIWSKVKLKLKLRVGKTKRILPIPMDYN